MLGPLRCEAIMAEKGSVCFAVAVADAELIVEADVSVGVSIETIGICLVVEVWLKRVVEQVAKGHEDSRIRYFV